jgi:8-amino-7-oxononanoate synthase
MNNLLIRIEQKLKLRKQEGRFRSLLSADSGIDFWSNDYLGYARIPFLNSENRGSTGSRLISGNSAFTEEVEQKIADFFKGESALLFNSGYDANLGLLSCLPQKNDCIIYDEHIHASMRDGIRLSFAKSYGFKHNSLEDLEKKLQIESGENGVKFVCIESLYSMAGDVPPLLRIIELCEKHDAYLIVDEAHSGGVYGGFGEGFSAALGFENRIFARIFTFGKAFGCHGAAIVGSKQLREYLINYSRSFIYTTALPKNSIAHIRENIQKTEFLENRKQLFQNIRYFRNLIDDEQIISISEANSPIQMIRIGNAVDTEQKALFLRENGFLVKAIVSPTVKKGDEAIRICIHAFNTKEEIYQLVEKLR